MITAVGVSALVSFAFGLADTNQNAVPIRIPLIATEINTDFILEVKQRIYNTGSGQSVREIEERERDNNDACGLEKYSLPRLVCDIQRTE